MLLAGTVVSSEGSARGCWGAAAKLTHVAVGRVQFLMGCWDEGPAPCWLAGRSLPDFSSTTPVMVLGADERERKST